MAFTPERTVNYESRVAFAGQQAMAGRPPLDGPLFLQLDAYFPIAQSWSKKKQAAATDGQLRHIGRPDLDNLLKAIGDGLNGVVWRDDAQIAAARISKWYGETPRVVIQVETIEAPVRSAAA